MMVKRQKITALIFFVTGLILLGVFAAGNRGDYNSGVFCGIGTSLSAVGLFRLAKLYRLSRNPEEKAEYEAAGKDERVHYIAGKARALAFAVSLYAQGAVALIAQFVFDQHLLSAVLCGFVCAECLLLVSMGVSTRIMNRKVF